MRKAIRAAAVALTVASLASGTGQVALASGGSHGSKPVKKKKKKKASKKTQGKKSKSKGKHSKGKKTSAAAGELEASAKIIEALAKATAKSDPQLSGELKKLAKRSH